MSIIKDNILRTFISVHYPFFAKKARAIKKVLEGFTSTIRLNHTTIKNLEGLTSLLENNSIRGLWVIYTRWELFFPGGGNFRRRDQGWRPRARLRWFQDVKYRCLAYMASLCGIFHTIMVSNTDFGQSFLESFASIVIISFIWLVKSRHRSRC